MEKGRKAARLAALLLTAAVFLTALGTISHARSRQLQRGGVTGQCNDLALPYIEENTRLRRQITQISARVETIERVGSRMTVNIFVQCGENLYLRCYPIAKRYDAACVFVITEGEMVGKEGCITLAQYDELLAAGWTAALSLPEDQQEAEKYLEELKGAFDRMERPLPDAVYLKSGEFTKERTEYLISKGFRTILHEYQEEYFEGFAFLMEGADDPVYIPYLYLAQNKKVFPDYERITSEGGCCGLATRRVVYNNEFEADGGADPLLDSTVSVMGNVFEVVVAEFDYQRSEAEYRQECYDSFVVLAEEKEKLREQIADLQAERKRLNKEIVKIFQAQLEL